MISIRVTAFPDNQKLGGMLMSLDRGMSDWRPVVPRLIERLRKQWAARFASENRQGPAGRWGPLSPDYAKWKQKHFPGRTILYGPDRRGHVGGMLMRSLTSGDEGSIIQYDQHSLFMGTTIPYAEYLIPQSRFKFVDPSERDVSELVAEIWRFIHTVKARAGFRGAQAVA